MAGSKQNRGQRRAAKVKARKKKLAKAERAEAEAEIPLSPGERLGRDLEQLADRGEEFTGDGFLVFVARHVRDTVADVLAERDVNLALDFSEVVDEFDEVALEDPDVEEPPGFGVAFSLLNQAVVDAAERVGSGERIPEEVYGWVAEHFVDDVVDECRRADKAITTSEAGVLREGDDILACMIVLAAGFAAVYGDGDVGWLALEVPPAEDGAEDGAADGQA